MLTPAGKAIPVRYAAPTTGIRQGAAAGAALIMVAGGRAECSHDRGERGSGTAARLSVLAGYALLAACTQLLWLSFAPVTTEASRAMGVSVGAAGDLAGIFPLLYVVRALPAGRWLDQRFERAK